MGTIPPLRSRRVAFCGASEAPNARAAKENQNMAKLEVPNFKNNKQEEPNWCWAAVAANVNNAMDPAHAIQQCEVVLKMLPVTATAGLTPCQCAKAQHPDDQLPLMVTLQKLQLLPTVLAVGAKPNKPADNLDQRVNLIEGAFNLAPPRPVCVTFADVQHFVAISAFDPENRHVWVANPALEPDDVVEYTDVGFNGHFEFDGVVTDLIVPQLTAAQPPAAAHI
jgi:hypothetical protein